MSCWSAGENADFTTIRTSCLMGVPTNQNSEYSVKVFMFVQEYSDVATGMVTRIWRSSISHRHGAVRSGAARRSTDRVMAQGINAKTSPKTMGRTPSVRTEPVAL